MVRQAARAVFRWRVGAGGQFTFVPPASSIAAAVPAAKGKLSPALNLPRGAFAGFECRPEQIVEHKTTHIIPIGEVVETALGERRSLV